MIFIFFYRCLETAFLLADERSYENATVSKKVQCSFTWPALERENYRNVSS